MKGRLLDMARHLDPECRIARGRDRDSPQAGGMGERTACGGTVEGFWIESGLGQQHGAVATRGLQGAANGLHPGSQRGSDTLILPGRRGSETGAALCPHIWYSPARASSPLERDVVVEVLFFLAAGRWRGLIIIIPG